MSRKLRVLKPGISSMRIAPLILVQNVGPLQDIMVDERERTYRDLLQ